MLRTPEAMLASLDRDEDLDSYVTTRDPQDETYYSRGLAEDAYVSVNTLFDPVVVNGKVVGVSAHDDNAVKDDGSQTITLEQYLGNVVSVALGDEPVHTVRVEGELMQVVDEARIIHKQDAVLNIYTDKDGYQRIGSVRIKYLASGTPVAECVKCKGTLIYKGESDDDAQAFTLAVVTHGHNHQVRGWNSTVVYDEFGGKFVGRRYVLNENNERVDLPPVSYFSERSRTVIGEPVALSITNNAALVEAYNDALFDQYVLDAYDTIAQADNLARFRRVNGF